MFVLKGGVLLAAFDTRRPTRDIDLAARGLDNDAEVVRRLMADVLEIDTDDGLSFDQQAMTATVTRDGDVYNGVRVTVPATLASARVRFHVDVNVGDPIVPEPEAIALPRLLGGELTVTGYPLEMVLAEKIVTAVQRGNANTRWRDFTDIARLTAVHAVEGRCLTASLHRVAEHRAVVLEPLTEVLDGYATVAQDKWSAWRRKQGLDDLTPERFDDLLTQVVSFSDPVLTDSTRDRQWDPVTRAWSEDPENAMTRASDQGQGILPLA